MKASAQISNPTRAGEPATIQPRRGFPALSRELGLAAFIVLLPVVLSVMYPISFRPYFWTTDNFGAILRNLAFEGFLAIGMMLMMVGGVFDLSVGAMASMIGVVTGWFMKVAGLPAPVAVLIGLLVAAAGGFLNGFIVAKVRVNALITTLGTMGIFKGIALLIGGPGITFLPPAFTRFGQAEPLGIQTPVWILLGLALAAHYCLAHTRFFRQYYYIGSNPKAARLSGIHVERLQIAAFTLMGMIAGLAGIIYSSRIATASSTLGDGKELGAITAVILGGASLAGGKGTVAGALIGVFFMALMQNVLILLRVSSEWQGITLGAVLVGAVAVDSVMNRKRS
jgi:ribose/xylose/arabinose/galactoside ABC-type transport system permease subunit